MKFKIKKYLKEFIHNIIIHPLIEFLPFYYGWYLHDLNANYTFGNNRYDEISLGYKNWFDKNNNTIKSNYKTFIHNVIIHPLMMFLPVQLANKLHDVNATWAFDL